MGLLRIFCSADDEKLFKSHLSTEADPIQELKSGDRLTIEFVLLQRNLSGSFKSPWARVLSGSYSLRIGLYLNSDRSELAFQNTFAAQDEFTRSGTLALDTVAAVAAVNAAPYEASCSFEIELTDSTGNDRTIYRETVTLKKALIASAGSSVPPGELVATRAWVKAIALPRDGGNAENPSDHFYIRTRPSGFIVQVTFKDDGSPEYQLQ